MHTWISSKCAFWLWSSLRPGPCVAMPSTKSKINKFNFEVCFEIAPFLKKSCDFFDIDPVPTHLNCMKF